ncbi:MAG: 4-hydroxy-3-methylbut-2-enyl diphosphate reductase [uncultured Gemmatimonadaceae bacterium]|uniref:4-hydroxy-3-methylbut-2-enyl diphosphate reductase n=1 Tax=uncultured Gemmatimonadaceae bacterium TaxID=246130 RepID=A0A6J4M3A0_9BACT|nr:MAG: 4-hydroxy-3-methylbut-2-enyl diphosphate reductase [uncultured Gemmatimonadaceae bacterium]
MSPTDNSATYYRKGFGLKSEVEAELAGDYSGRLVDLLRERDYVLTAGDVTVRLAQEFGFCYGVERAVDYAYQTRRKFPDRRIFLAGEIIHNPHVNAKLRDMGIEFLGALGTGFDYARVEPNDVVILPAFVVTIQDFETLRALGCVVVDTTCGSVLNVWKRVESYARDGFTSLIHGKYYHEETRATASQAQRYAGAHYLVVRNMEEAGEVVAYVEGRGDRAGFLERFAKAASPGFDPDLHLGRIGVANQTTMLARESLAIGEVVGQAMARARGDAYRAANFRTFDTICSATQDRQDAVEALLKEGPDVMLVIGGFNSSNTMSLAAICAERVPTYHVEDAFGIDPEAGTVHHRPVGVHAEPTDARGWLPAAGPVTVGVTAGASTPNNKIGEAVARVFLTRGIDPALVG